MVIYHELCPSLVRTYLISVCHKISHTGAGTSFVNDSGLGVTSDFDQEPGDSYHDSWSEEIRSLVAHLWHLAQQWE